MKQCDGSFVKYMMLIVDIIETYTPSNGLIKSST